MVHVIYASLGSDRVPVDGYVPCLREVGLLWRIERINDKLRTDLIIIITDERRQKEREWGKSRRLKL